MALWMPSGVSRELHESNRQFSAELIAEARRDAILQFWTKELKQLDPYLELVQAKEDATYMRPGFYHILRHNPGAPPTFMCVEGPNGEFMEPNSGIFDLLRRRDMWSAEASHDRKRMMQAAEAAEARRKEREREARMEELEERWKAATRAQVSMSRDVRWSQNVAGARGRRR